jgi:hypothetical protein
MAGQVLGAVAVFASVMGLLAAAEVRWPINCAHCGVLVTDPGAAVRRHGRLRRHLYCDARCAAARDGAVL